MFLDMIQGALFSLANQWSDLAESFERFAAALLSAGPDSPSISIADWELFVAKVGGLDSAGKPLGFQGLCDRPEDPSIPDPGGEKQRIQQVIDTLFTPPTAVPIADAPSLLNLCSQVFRDSEGFPAVPGRRAIIKSKFFSLFAGRSKLKSIAEHQICKVKIENLGLFIDRSLLELQEVMTEEGQRINIRGVRRTVDDLASYPILTSEVYPGARGSSPSGGGVGGTIVSLQRTVEGAIRDVLGRLPRSNDTRSFLVSLTQSFELNEVQGHTAYKWTPRSFAGQTDLGGGVTGGQASLFSRAKVSLDNALPLLEGLYPLSDAPDPQNIEAARSIVRSDLNQIVAELGIEGGPREARVQILFDQLLGGEDPNPLVAQANFEASHLGVLQDELGLEADAVNTLDEENNLTNFISLRDYATSIRQSWDTFRTKFLGKDLGTRLVLLSRALSVASETVNEVYSAMDSVFVGEPERQVTSFAGEGGRPILVQELLTWIVSFTTEEAPRLVYEGGRRGVGAIVPTAFLLDSLVRKLIQAIASDPLMPEGLRHPRVRPPLQELQSYLQRIAQLSQDVRAA